MNDKPIEILLVAGDLDAAPLIRGIIAKAIPVSHTVTVCFTEESALAKLRSGGPFDLAIVNLSVPHGPNVKGAVISQAAKLRSSETKVIVMSGRFEADEKNIRSLCGADDYLSKPFPNKAVEDMIRRLLNLDQVPAPA